MKRYSWLPVFIIITCISCHVLKSGSQRKDDGKLKVVFVQVNDVYEIAPVEGGKAGGLARVASLKKQLKQKNSNTFLVMAGDFLSPSVYNSLQYQGERIRGKQMVECMNAAGTDFVIFGNHEFDLTEKELQQRINESSFEWISSNAFHIIKDKVVPFEKQGAKLPAFHTAHILSLRDNDGTTARIGLIGIVIPANKAEYVSYTDPITTAKELYNQIKDSCDGVIAITHQFVETDKKLAEEIPSLITIIGGHEHDMRFEKVGNVFITKAHANARTAYVINININKKKHTIKVHPVLKKLNPGVKLDSATNLVVQKWIHIADSNYSSLGFDPKKMIMGTGDPLEGREIYTRKQSTNLTRLITAAVMNACPQAEVVIVNSGSIRLDDVLYPPVSEYDILRTLPFGGGIREVDMKGSLLVKILTEGKKNIGNGGFLQYQPVVYNSSNDSWTIKNNPVNPDKTYRVAITDFLLTGKETNLDFLNERNPEIVRVYPAETSTIDPRSDIRLAIIRYLLK